LKDLHHVEIQLDQKALEDSGIALDKPVTKNLKGISLRSGLGIVLRDLGLSYTIDNEVLLITTKEKADEMCITKVYDVGDLVAFHDKKGDWDDYDSLVELIREIVAPWSWNTVGGPGSIVGYRRGDARLLAVSNPYRVQHEVGSFLDNLRAVAKASGKVTPTELERPSSQPDSKGMGGVPIGKDGKPVAAAPSK
jgi:hypothetical protein